MGADMTKTIFAREFSRLGFAQRDVDFHLSVARFANNGGAYEDAISIVRAAFGIDGESWHLFASRRKVDGEGHYVSSVEDIHDSPSPSRKAGAGHSYVAHRDPGSAPASAPLATAGHFGAAASNADIQLVPAAAPIPAPKSKAHFFTGGVGHNSGGGQKPIAAHTDSNAVQPPEPIHVREHDRRKSGHAKRGMDAIASVQGTIARSLFDTYIIDGSPIGDLTFGEARRLGRKYGESHYVLAAICAHVQADDSVSIRDGIKEADLRDFIFNARRDADVF